MTDVPPSFPEEGQVFDGPRTERFLAVALETLVQDVSPVGDQDVARDLGAYSLGDSDPPEAAPEYVELEDGLLTLTNPPFLLAEIELDEDGYALHCEFDSELKLLIEPPVEVALEAESFDELLESFEQMIAEIYRTRGRRLEMLDEGVVDPEEFSEPR
ncbi:hypothetical protein HWV07_00240 [Natronomonas salina]|uniref:hypothetical protein n=1 Tax=Natronomonas salina TaxID=1710540 RepID=UPI0015B602F1|nr:hypothetical protein [Natronomonas salina]QLD87545.1 hypothetical protein HWV07_00240 [Natronomonas salina]